MWFCLLCLLLLLGVAFYQSIHGLFSGLVFCVIAIVSTALAFSLYQYVAYEFLAAWKPDIALPVALAACFGLPLVLLRAGLDSLIRRAGLLPALADKIGGAFFGAIAALLCVGVMTVAVQMLPFGGSFMTFSRFDLPQTAEEGRTPVADVNASAARVLAGDDNHLWLSPDRFAVGFASMLSDGLFRGKQSFRVDHPDLMAETGWAQAVSAGVRRLAPPGSASVELARVQPYIHRKIGASRDNPAITYDLVSPPAGRAFWSYKLQLTAEAQDADNRHRFSLPQIRMLGWDRHGDAVQLIPCAVQDDYDPTKVVRAERRGREDRAVLFELWSPSSDGSVEVVFEVPDGFESTFICYKQGAWARAVKPDPADTPPPAPATPSAAPATPEPSDDAPPPTSSRRRSRRRGSDSTSSGNSSSGSASSGGGRVTGARVFPADSRFSDEFPVRLTSYESVPGRTADTSGGAFREGSIYGAAGAEATAGSQAPITKFFVPQGKRLLHLSVETLRAGSTLGRALNFATRTIGNYIVTDDSGQRYEMAGQYAVANVDGEQIIEIQYFPEQIGSMGRGVGDFSRIKRRHLEQNDTEQVFLFLIDEGRQAVAFSTGPRGRVDLHSSNLRAE